MAENFTAKQQRVQISEGFFLCVLCVFAVKILFPAHPRESAVRFSDSGFFPKGDITLQNQCVIPVTDDEKDCGSDLFIILCSGREKPKEDSGKSLLPCSGREKSMEDSGG